MTKWNMATKNAKSHEEDTEKRKEDWEKPQISPMDTDKIK
jgi:hypothetical protein